MSIKNELLRCFKNSCFSLMQAYEKIPNYPKDSVRARIYEHLGTDFDRVGRGLYIAKDNTDSVALIEGDGRDLSFLEPESVSMIIADHPYSISKQLKGGNRDFAQYECFRYTLEDFKSKYEVLKPGCFLCEFIPAETADNFEYLYEIKSLAIEAGFQYYCKVPWKKGKTVSNVGRKSKNTEEIIVFSRGRAANFRPDKKKDIAEPGIQHFMSGARAMFPTEFDFEPPSKKTRIHQAEKPVALIESLLELMSFEGDVVLDQYAGSGVVGEACRNMKRKAILIEKSKEYINNIIERLQLKCASVQTGVVAC